MQKLVDTHISYRNAVYVFFAFDGHYLFKYVLFRTETECLILLHSVPTNLSNTSQEAHAQEFLVRKNNASCDSGRFIAVQYPGQIWLIALNPFR